MSAPKFNTPDGPPQCPHCGGPIRYQERHRRDGVWVHIHCVGFGTREHMLRALDEMGIPETDENHRHGLAILACMNSPPGDFGAAAELVNLEPSFVRHAMEPLVEAGIYKDGTWYYDKDVDIEDPQQSAIQILVWILVSSRMLEVRKNQPEVLS